MEEYIPHTAGGGHGRNHTHNTQLTNHSSDIQRNNKMRNQHMKAFQRMYVFTTSQNTSKRVHIYPSKDTSKGYTCMPVPPSPHACLQGDTCSLPELCLQNAPPSQTPLFWSWNGENLEASENFMRFSRKPTIHAYT